MAEYLDVDGARGNTPWFTAGIGLLFLVLGVCIGIAVAPRYAAMKKAAAPDVALGTVPVRGDASPVDTYAATVDSSDVPSIKTVRVDAYPMHVSGTAKTTHDELTAAGVFENNTSTLLSDDWQTSPGTILDTSNHQTFYVASFPAGTTNRAAIAWAHAHGFRHGTHHELIRLALSRNVLRFDPNPEYSRTRQGWSTAWINAIGDFDGHLDNWTIAVLDPHQHGSACVPDCAIGADIGLTGEFDGTTLLDYSWRLNEQFLLIKKSAK